MAEIVESVQQLAHRYRVHLALGQLKVIRESRRKGAGKSREYRRELHRWVFARIAEMLAYELQRIGLPSEQFKPIKEAWTSRTCSRCGSRATTRPFQGLLICHACGAYLQADGNSAINIALKLIFSLDKVALDHWLTLPLLGRKSRSRTARMTNR